MSARTRAARIAVGGVILMIAGVAGLVIVPANTVLENRVVRPPYGGLPGLSRGTYELLLILSWAGLLMGALIVAISLIDYARD